MKCRRSVLAELSRPVSVHPGLWLDRFLKEQTETGGDGKGTGEKQILIREVEGLPAPEGYREAAERREQALRAIGDVTFATARVEGRLAIGLGQKGTIEAGLALERTWGVPFLPGSALKGLAAAAAEKLVEDDGWRKPRAGDPATPGGESYRELFGTTDDRGGVVFHDAWWVPEGTEPKIPIHLDVMTVHHPEYYQKGTAPPRDTDSPVPVPFATVAGSYRVAVEGPGEWRDAALDLLEMGLAGLGLGAKTNAGYGRMKLDVEGRAAAPPGRAGPALRPAGVPPRSPLFEELGAVRANEIAGRFPNLVTKAESSLAVGERAEWAAAALERLDARARKAFQKKPWYENLVRWVTAAREQGDREGA